MKLNLEPGDGFPLDGFHVRQGGVKDLNAIKRSEENQPNGIAISDQDNLVPLGLIDPNSIVYVPMLFGPLEISENSCAEYHITNFHYNRDYVVTSTDGTVTINHDIVKFCPLGVGEKRFTVSGRIFTVSAMGAYVERPTITGNALATTPTVTLNASAFSVKNTTDSYKNTDWELSEFENFSTVLKASYASNVNYRSWTVTDLSYGKTYYARVRHRAMNLPDASSWSDTFVFKTSSDVRIATPSVLTPPNNGSNIAINTVFTSSAFMVQNWVDTQAEVEWQLSLVSDFSNILDTVVTTDPSMFTEWTPGGMVINAIYYVRVRYRGTLLGWSAWSNTNMFRTAQPQITRPSVVNPLNNTEGMNSTIDFTTSTFSATGGVGHAATNWEIARDINFTDIVYSKLEDTVNKTSLHLKLTSFTELYVRVQYIAEGGFVSQWSPINRFKTDGDQPEYFYWPAGALRIAQHATETVLLHTDWASAGGTGVTMVPLGGAIDFSTRPTPTATGFSSYNNQSTLYNSRSFNAWTAFSKNGNFGLLSSDAGTGWDDTDRKAGVVDVLKKDSQGKMVKDKTIILAGQQGGVAFPWSLEDFGKHMAISNDGLNVYISAVYDNYSAPPNNATCHVLHYYRANTSSSFILKSRFYDPDFEVDGIEVGFGFGLDCSNDGKQLFVGTISRRKAAVGRRTVCYHYSQDTSGIPVLKQKIQAPVLAVTGYNYESKNSISVSGDGKTLITSGYYEDPTTYANAFLFEDNGSSFVFTQSITTDLLETPGYRDQGPRACVISEDGKVVAVQGHNQLYDKRIPVNDPQFPTYTSQETPGTGIHIYKKVNNVWKFQKEVRYSYKGIYLLGSGFGMFGSQIALNQTGSALFTGLTSWTSVNGPFRSNGGVLRYDIS